MEEDYSEEDQEGMHVACVSMAELAKHNGGEYYDLHALLGICFQWPEDDSNLFEKRCMN